MINDSGYFYPDETGACDTRYELSVNSAGRYKLIRRESFETIRPAGRNDFQLLYLAGGSADFVIGGKNFHLTGSILASFHRKSGGQLGEPGGIFPQRFLQNRTPE